MTLTHRRFFTSLILRTLLISLSLIGLVAGILLQLTNSALAAEEATYSKETVRPEVGGLLQAA